VTGRPAPRRSLLDRYLAAMPVAVAVLALLALLFWEASIRRTPTIFTDELEWTQLSRAIAATGHAARRGTPISFKSLYAFLIAPGWWIHSTGAAYATIKYLDTFVMALAAIPAYLLAKTMVPTRAAIVAALASLCTTALFYAGLLLPEVLAYPMFVLCAWVSIRALAGGGRRWIAAAIVLDLIAPEVRGELVTVPAAFAIAAFVLLVVGPRGQRLRRSWGIRGHVGAALALLAVLYLANRVLGPHAHEWQTVTTSWRGRLWSLGLQAQSALALGLGLLPFAGGLASLWIPERRGDPSWRAFSAFTAAAILTVGTYTGVKAAYLSTVFATRVEERNLIYLGPLLLIGTAVWLCSHRRFLPGTIAAWAITAWLVLHYGYQLDFPYFEAPGYGIAAMANRAWAWNQPDIRIGLAVSCAVLFAASLAAGRVRRPVVLLAVAATVTWMLAGEITSTRGSAFQSKAYADHLAKPFDWVDRATSGHGTTFIGQNISSGEALGVNLLEFWNHSVKNIWSLDGSAPGPGGTLTPDLANADGTLRSDPDLDYVVATDGLVFVGPVVARQPGVTLRRIEHHPWALREAIYGVSDDGWITAADPEDTASGRFAYFGPKHTPGTLHIDVGRTGFCSTAVPRTHVVVRVGTIVLDEQRSPVIGRARRTERFLLPNCLTKSISLTVTPPVVVQVSAFPTVNPSKYGGSDNRNLGAQVGFSFRSTR